MPSSRVFNFTEPQLYQAAISAARNVAVYPTTKGDFRADLIQIELDRLWMQRASESLPRIMYGAVTPDRAAVEFPVRRDQPGFRHDGIEVSPGEIVVDSAEASHTLSCAPCHWGAMSLTTADLAAAGLAFAGRDLTRPSVARVIRPALRLMSRLLDLHERAAHLAKSAPARLAHPQAARSLEEALIHVMILCVSDGVPAEPPAGGGRHCVVMARFEEFLAANPDQPLHLANICAAIGVSDRTLRACCQEHLGMGPLCYLRLRRMHLVRRALVQASPQTSTVTGIATEYGFWELGRFSIEYRQRFGESPSATLRRPPRNPPSRRDDPFAFAASGAG